MASTTPIVDCGVHYVDVMCQLTGARPVRVHGIGAKLSAETEVQNYGHLHVVFEDGSVGWYEAGWGPMMSEVAYFVKDVWGPKGSISIVMRQDGTTEARGDQVSASADVDQHTRTNALKLHHAELDAAGNFARADEWLDMSDEPDHQALCEREQAWFLRTIREDIDLARSMAEAVTSLRIVLAAQQSIDESAGGGTLAHAAGVTQQSAVDRLRLWRTIPPWTNRPIEIGRWSRRPRSWRSPMPCPRSSPHGGGSGGREDRRAEPLLGWTGSAGWRCWLTSSAAATRARARPAGAIAPRGAAPTERQRQGAAPGP